MAERMVAHFGAGILAVIETEPGRLIEVHGLGPKRTKKIAEAWEEQKAIKEVMVFLSGVGVSTSLAVRIYKKYAGASITIVKNEPYRLASEVWGIGFKTADTIAQAVGIPHDSPERIRAGLQYTLSQAADNGHCYLPQPNLITDATKILEVDRELIGPCLDELVAAEDAVRELVPGEGGDLLPAVYLVAFHRAEQSLAAGLLALLNSRQERLPALGAVDWGKAWRWLHARTGQDLAHAQQEAAQLALTQKVAVLTGGPGCGKSFTVRSIVELATAAPWPRPSAPAEQAAATPRSPTGSTPPCRPAVPSPRQRARALCDVSVTGLPAQTARSTQTAPRYRRNAGPLH
jgi:exodeoxyribonuclease V alpha subunit